MFELDPRLDQDTEFLTALPLSRLLIMRDARYKWLVLVPARPGLKELHDLDRADRGQLVEEIAMASRALERLYTPDKINVGALGNIVAQLHVHVLARRVGDPAWPGPVWGHSEATPYAPDDLAKTREDLIAAIGSDIENSGGQKG